MDIRDATANDYEDVRHVTQITWLATYPNKEHGITKEEIKARFNQPPRRPIEEAKKAIEGDENGHYWVAEDSGTVVGFCSALRKDGKARIGAIYVLPEYQGRGIGKKLISRGLKWLGGKEDIFVSVAVYNTSSIKFYEGLGFIKTDKAERSPAAKLPFGSLIPEIEMVRMAEH